MGLAVRPILIHLCSLSSPLLFLLLFFLLCSISTFAGNLPSSPYFPADGDIQFQNCRCFENNDGVASHTPIPHSSRPRILKLVLYFGQGNAIATAVIMVITLLNVVAFKLRELEEAKSGETNDPALSLSSEYSCRKFSIAEMKLATQNFDEALVIGKGGFGKVYKGLINHEASVVAIKRLDSKSKQGASEFWTEIKMLSKLRHSHLVSLFGYCNDFDEMILVYEYVASGSLADRLHKIGKSIGLSSLSWVQRLKICLGAARGLDYLHTSTGVQHRVIHRDVKSSNILLDENWCAKISDFGVSKAGPLNQPWTYVSTDVKGSFGYFDPEYFLTRRLTRKSDVYSFGVVLFEVLFGRPAVDLSREEEQRGLAGWGLQCIKEGIVEESIDPNLRGQILPNCLILYVQIAGQCLQNLPRKRPTMSEVVFKLESALALQEIADYSVVEGEVEAGDTYDNQGKENFSMAEGSVSGNGESNTGPIDGTTQSRLGDANSKKSFRKSAGIIPFSRTLRQFFSVKGHVDSVYSDAKRSRNKNSSNGRTHYSRFPVKDLVPSKDGGVVLEVSNVEVFTLSELKRATGNFKPDTLLGEGGFGQVYKGVVSKETYALSKKVGIGMTVAIKKLATQSTQGYKEWQAEVNFLGKLSHANVVKLLGYCWEDQALLLVYEYMPKGSLDQYLFKNVAEPLSWPTRLNIMIGAARGLAFMHSLKAQLIFRDFKTHNILLDAEFNSKISDFGLVRIFDPITGDATHVSTALVGTHGYAAPEYIATGHVSVKSDLYGFGVVLLEVLTGQQVLDRNRPAARRNLVDWIKPLLTKKTRLKEIIDPRLGHDFPLEGAFKAAALVQKCLQLDPKARPSMNEVLETLEQISMIKIKRKELEIGR